MTGGANFMAFDAYFYVEIREMNTEQRIYEYFFV